MPRQLAYIIPAHNAQATLAETLASIAAAIAPRASGGAIPRIETIIIDDNSTDQTVRTAQEAFATFPALHGRVIRAHSEASAAAAALGPAGARLAGLNAATAQFVCFLDADDLCEPHSACDMLAAVGLLGISDDRASFDACCGGFRLIDSAGEDLCWSHTPESGDWSPQRLATANRLTIGAVIVAREALLTAARRQSEMFASGCASEDWAMWLHLARDSHDAPSPVRWGPVIERAVLAYRQQEGARSRKIMANLASGVEIISRFTTDRDEAKAAAMGLLRRAVCEALLDDQRELMLAAAHDIPPDSRGGEFAAAAFVAPLRWGLACRGYLRPPAMARAMSEVLPAVARLAAGTLHFDWSTLFRRALCGPEQLAMAASRLHATLGPSGRLVIYGLGRSGRAALKLVSQRGGVVAIDDDPARQSPVPRITVDDLTANDAVLVTPDLRGPILGRIDGTPARVLLPEDLLLGRG